MIFVELFGHPSDDFQLYAADDISNISLCLERVNSDLDAIYRWSVANGLLLNCKKTQAMITGSGSAAFSCGGIAT
jgi:hypothetical protein